MSTVAGPPLRVELLDGPSGGRFGQITLQRPHRAHAYDRATLLALREARAALEAEVHVVVLCADGDGAFCAGADREALAAASPVDALDLLSQRVFDELARSPMVSVAAVHGPAVAGGCELALACDLRVIGPRARFSLPETGLGLVPAAGGCTRLARLVGGSLARDVILGGATIDADRAAQAGLGRGPVNDPRAAARALAGQLCQRDPVALRLAKLILDGDGGAASLSLERVAEALLYSRRP
jgi:enoyl-CoA hydratase/carnithine racemase